METNIFLKKSLSLFLLIFSFNAESALYGYCLSRDASVSGAKSFLESVKAPRDEIFTRESVNCIEVQGGAQRFDLYEKFLSKRFRIIRTYKGTDAGAAQVDLVASMCRIAVIKIGKKDTAVNTVEVGKSGVVKRSEFDGSSKSISNLVLTNGKRGSIKVNDESVGITCRKAGSQYQLEFDLESKEQRLSSNAYLSKGHQLNVGNIVQELNNKRRKISIDKGVEYEKEVGKQKFDYYLEIQ